MLDAEHDNTAVNHTCGITVDVSVTKVAADKKSICIKMTEVYRPAVRWVIPEGWCWTSAGVTPQASAQVPLGPVKKTVCPAPYKSDCYQRVQSETIIHKVRFLLTCADVGFSRKVNGGRAGACSPGL